MTEQRSWRQVAAQAARVTRDGWAIAGIACLVFLMLEGGYRLQGSLRRAWSGTTLATGPRPLPSGHPYADSAWYPAFLRERLSLRFRWEPFVYSRHRPLAGRYVNSDSAGFRPVPRVQVAGGARVRLFDFGGSTTWGYFDRDSSTRPAVEARRLAAAGYDAEVVNFGQLGYTSAQELVALVMELRRGNVPDAVVFWDGVNDLLSARSNARPGVTMREFERAEDADFNARRRANGMRVDDALAVRTLASHSALLARLFAATATPAPVRPMPDPVPFCRSLMRDWVDQARVIDHLANAYGFVALVIWQPQWKPSGRPRSEYERGHASYRTLALADAEIDTPQVECARVADSLVTARAAESIVNFAALHRADTGTVFLDRYSHTTERATAIEGDTVAALVIARLRARPPRGRARP